MDIAKYWETIFDTLREGLIVVDPGGKILDINASAERITGYSVDEIGDIPASIQVKLLRVLEEKEIERVGDHQPVPVDGRVISATNRNMEHLPAKITAGASFCPPSGGAREQLVKALDEFGQNRSEAAKILGVSRVTVWKRMKKYNIA